LVVGVRYISESRPQVEVAMPMLAEVAD
jgi:hypothetical protein